MKFISKYKSPAVFLALVLLTASCSLISTSGGGGNSGTVTGLHPLGAKFDNAALSVKMQLSESAGSGTLPAGPVDLSSGGYFPPIGDQGSNGDCVAWATAYYMLTYMAAKANGWSPAEVATASYEFSPDWVYYQINSGIDDGSFPSDAFSLIVLKGCDTLNNFNLNGFPYYNSDWPSVPGDYSTAINYAQPGWSYVNQDVGSIETVLASGKPVVIAIMVYTPDFDTLSTNGIYHTTNAFTNYQSTSPYNGQSFTGTIYTNSNYRGGHAICLVGFDNTKGAFKFINSWTSSWGISGYGWITTNFVNSVIIEALTFN